MIFYLYIGYPISQLIFFLYKNFYFNFINKLLTKNIELKYIVL